MLLSKEIDLRLMILLIFFIAFRRPCVSCVINYCGTYFCDFDPKSQKLDPQNTVRMSQSQK